MASRTLTSTWKIYDLLADYPTLTVHSVTYGLEASLEFTHSGSNYTYDDRRVGTVEITAPTDPADVIPFADLTEQNVIDWVTLDSGSIDGRTGGLGVVGAAALETELSSSLTAKRIEFEGTVTGSVGLPWE